MSRNESTVLTDTEMARGLKCDRKLVARYRIRGMPMGSVDDAQAWKDANVRLRVNSRSGPAAERETDPGVKKPRQPDDADLQIPPWQDSKAKQAYLDARAAEIALEKLEGSLIEVAKVKAELGKQFAPIREGLLNIPARMAPSLHACKSPAEVQTMLDTEIRAVLAQYVGEA